MQNKFCCINCNTSFKRKTHLIQHLDRKNSCINKQIQNIYSFPLQSSSSSSLTLFDHPLSAPLAPLSAPHHSSSSSLTLSSSLKLDKNILTNKIDTTIRIENNEKKYKCKFCNKYFSKKFNLDRHIKNICEKNNEVKEANKVKEINEVKEAKEINEVKEQLNLLSK